MRIENLKLRPTIALGLSILTFTACDRKPVGPSPSPAPATNPAAQVAYGGSASCQSCHAEAYQHWKYSHHALAERLVDPPRDQAAFDPARRISHGTQSSQALWSNGVPHLVTPGLHGTNQTFAVARVIGVDPLLQYLIPAPGGRFQAGELCFDPARMEWFNVYGAEDRRPGEWGHWTGRGMNWNNMCAVCHNTRFQKNYDAATDTFRSTFAEMGVGCEACHGPMADHNAWQTQHPHQSGDPTIRPLDREQMLSVCAQCHARRGELTPDFHPGEDFLDHHTLTIPDDTEVFYADGQVHEEDYEFNAFLGSKMHAAGVRCVDCHEPHSMKLRLPGNFMCLSCHSGGELPVATNALNTRPVGPRIDPATHSRHKAGERGDACVDCHMPVTTYMQRHPRHDHGFTIPDPRLTKQFNIPNACNRCHADKSADWSLAAIEKWYGTRTNHTVLARTEAIVRARRGEAAALPGLLQLAGESTNAYWRAVALNFLRPWGTATNVLNRLLSGAMDTNALVRSVSVRALESGLSAGHPEAIRTAREKLADPVRSVRIEAAWALRREVDTNSPAGRDLLAHLRHNADQPQGQMQLGVFQFDRGDVVGATASLRLAISWDPNSAPLHDTLAVILSAQGRSAEAVASLQSAVRLAPNQAEYRYRLGLAFSEIGELRQAQASLAEAVRLEPGFARAWYNLGLAQSSLQQPEAALESLIRAESLDSNSAMIPYARATILARLGRANEARTAAQRALELDRNFTAARQLLQALP